MDNPKIIELYHALSKEILLAINQSRDVDIQLNKELSETDKNKVQLLYESLEDEIILDKSSSKLSAFTNLGKTKMIDKSFATEALHSFFETENRNDDAGEIRIIENISDSIYQATSDYQNILNSIIDISLNLFLSIFISYFLLLDSSINNFTNINEVFFYFVPFYLIFCLSWIVFGTFQITIWGKTIGSRFVGSVILAENGNMPGFKKSLLRALSQIAVFLTLGLLNVIFLRKIYFHDFIAGTRKLTKRH